MLTDKTIILHTKQDFDIIDDLREEKVIFAKESAFPSISLGIKGYDQHNGTHSVTVIDMGKLLLQCSKEGDLGKVHGLIARGAPFTTDWLGMSALHFAAMNNNYEVCEVLLRGGINKDAKTKVDRTPLHFAAYEGHENIVKLLLSKNCDINPSDMLRMTPLHWAIERGHKNIARILIRSGAKVTAVSKFNKTPISIAIQTKQTDLLSELEAEKEVQEKAAIKTNPDENQSETETSQAVKSIAGVSNYDNMMANLNEEFASMERTSFNSENADIKYEQKIEEICENKTETCHSSDDLIDEDMDYVEPIIQLDSIDDEPKQFNSSALELLKCHGISMLPADDPENNLITSALESGRKLVLSEAGKRILNDTRMKVMSENMPPLNSIERNGVNEEYKKSSINNKSPVLLRAKGLPLKPNKNIKIISMDTFKRMYGPEMANNIRKAQAQIRSQDGSLTPTITKITKIPNSSTNEIKGLSKKPQPTARIISVQRLSRKTIEEDLPPNIDICSDSESEESTSVSGRQKLEPIANITIAKPTSTTSSPQPTVYNNTNSTSTSFKPQLEKCLKLPVLNLSEVTRQIFLLRKQLDDLRKQFQFVQKENAEYKTRIEQLERDRDRYMQDIM